MYIYVLECPLSIGIKKLCSKVRWGGRGVWFSLRENLPIFSLLEKILWTLIGKSRYIYAQNSKYLNYIKFSKYRDTHMFKVFQIFQKAGMYELPRTNTDHFKKARQNEGISIWASGQIGNHFYLHAFQSDTIACHQQRIS